MIALTDPTTFNAPWPYYSYDTWTNATTSTTVTLTLPVYGSYGSTLLREDLRLARDRRVRPAAVPRTHPPVAVELATEDPGSAPRPRVAMRSPPTRRRWCARDAVPVRTRRRVRVWERNETRLEAVGC